MLRSIKTIIGAAIILAALGPAPAHAQFGKLKDKVKQKVDSKVNEKVDCTLEKYADNKECANAKPASSNAGSATKGSSAKGDAASSKPGEGAWANFDFVPGARPIFVEDFTRDRVGNFPKRLELQYGTFEVVDWEGKRWLRSSNASEFTINLPEALPSRWTMEFDMTLPWWGMFIVPGEALAPGFDPKHDGQYIRLGVDNMVSASPTKQTRWDTRELLGSDIFGSGSLTPPVRVRIHADGGYMKVYINENRVANMPNMGAWTGNQLHFVFNENTNQGKIEGPLISNISINAGGRDMYDALTADGRLAVQGIYFDTGSDRIRPESSGTLTEISEMLSEHPELKLVIEGHTDNVGDAAANQKLSEARAAAVVQTLTSSYKVGADRLKSAGFGAAKPAKPNDTPEGRQANRRVELVVQK